MKSRMSSTTWNASPRRSPYRRMRRDAGSERPARMRAALAGQHEQRGRLAPDRLVVLLAGQRLLGRVAARRLLDLALAHARQRLREQADHPNVAGRHAARRRLREQVVADQYRERVADPREQRLARRAAGPTRRRRRRGPGWRACSSSTPTAMFSIARRRTVPSRPVSSASAGRSRLPLPGNTIDSIGPSSGWSGWAVSASVALDRRQTVLHQGE